jgi:tetratricopeptide (TPR) repeat protein
LGEAKAHEAAHEEDVAIRRYSEALALDPTYEPAYLGLGELRARRGDAREAERVYSVALEHVPLLRVALVGRARARRVQGARLDADLDLERYLMTEEDVEELRELARWYGEEGRTAAQLSVWRRALAVSARTSDARLAHEAQTMVRALQILVGPADPVTMPPNGDATRRAIAAIAKRSG